ncbi:exodeoxyribonuclease V subunit beta [Halopseudomonas maritima]|uniref:exodeoxyribonuclease V subunit beta n=1 Tax=Halopseudomonas maritima TaxID=2918528 RepID=UPI001EECB18E|nr:exodeoxyribonuclease V subunit beta [Halopseudomonas maritima]UJJ32806.1 exodeoxyribonuclease V subunit beta [Halopseudomonas maritima]
MSNQRPLALRCPLRGSRLIEASAGTGKTFTISALYLRLVLGHGEGDSAFSRELLPPDVLVVTFTEAATQELRDRIRARLVEGAQAFRGELSEPDPILSGLLADIPEAEHPSAARKLDIAAQWMDQAAVSTIHSWCQRMLREHAFDSGSLFTQTLETDQRDLLAEVARDYWRLHCYHLRGAALSWVQQIWQQPDTLLGKTRLLFNPASAEPATALQALLDQALAQRDAQLAELKAPCAEWADSLEVLLDQAVEQGVVDKRKIQKRYYAPWFATLRQWALTPEQVKLELPAAAWARLSEDGLGEAWKKGDVPDHPALRGLPQLREALAALPNPESDALRHAADWMSVRFEAEKRRRAQMGFDDMLTRLDAALQGPNGDRLADVIRQQFPVALIDEFQDTDPLQYRIFDRIYRVAENDQDSALLLIGDPKQAIYAFRGADIHTYLRARGDTAGRHENLDTNFRSSQPMVAAVNRVFEQAEQHFAAGAFLFRQGNDNPMPFLPVQARGRSEVWSYQGERAPALTAWLLESEEPLTGDTYRREMAERCASEMTALLQAGQQGSAGFARSDQPFAPVRPADMAVLVRTGREAQLIRDALAARGVRSVYLSDKDSVLATQQAQDVLRWLRACAEPGNDRLLRAALASHSLHLNWQALDQLNQDERLWEQRVDQFRDYRRIWQRQGVLPMLHRLLHDFALPARLQQQDDGERALTNLLHLAELLQRAARELDGEQALIRHLAELIRRADEGAGDEQVLRLESDAELVKVVTIHKSKGLEYPLVFLPFICLSRPVRADQPLRLSDGWVLKPDADQVAEADRERLGEDLRLLYVALTRACHACWLGMADLKSGNNKQSVLHHSAIAWLLGGGATLESSGQLKDWLARWQPDGEVVALQAAPGPRDDRLQLLDDGPALVDARSPSHGRFDSWWIGSYSALALSGESTDSALAEWIADDERQSRFVPLRRGEQATIHRFPRGPQPGTFLHGLLDLAAQEGFAALQDAERCRRWLAPRCQRRGWGEWSECLSDWLVQLLQRPGLVPDTTLALGELPQSRYQSEMAFMFAAGKVDVQQVDRLVTAMTLDGLPRPALQRDRLNGLFKGYIDLVLEHEGRYYVLDYKSNWLGATPADYSEAAMSRALLEHRYDLQYVFYLLALHRQLRARLPDYDYDRHIGGALYWFVRGVDAENGGICHQRPPRELIEALDRLFAGQPVEEIDHAG